MTVSVKSIDLTHGGIGTYITAVLSYNRDKEMEKLRAVNELKAKYDISLRDKRIEVYQELWKRLEPFAIYSPPAEVNLFTLQCVSVRLRKWYCEIGGMFLIEESRTSYLVEWCSYDSMDNILDNFW
jgi:hypothetical protein